ncbi:CD0415/CD1112 family protein [Bengtsoniella intestinalis]|uniref:VirB6/TrbL-like conjugal transfer protein, CD1112 family n=1 Tax=Bengtsoniella intestinalis TaxID=3073143 RepID=UPI00391F3D9A
MDIILEAINEWMKAMLVDGIMGSLTGIFDTMNDEVASIATNVGMTPSQWNSGVFTMIQNLSDAVILPIAGMILTFIMCYELIQMVMERNNFHDFETFTIFKWMFKTCIAVMIVTNTFSIVMAIFDVAQSVIQNAAGVISTSTSVSVDSMSNLQSTLESMEVGALLGLYLQSFVLGFVMKALGICVFIIIYGRMLEIYLMTSLAAIPLSTMGNREWNIGQNYIKSLCALGFQGFLIMVCIGIYAILIQSISTSGDPIDAIWTCLMYTILLCFALFKTGSLAKSIFSAH